MRVLRHIIFLVTWFPVILLFTAISDGNQSISRISAVVYPIIYYSVIWKSKKKSSDESYDEEDESEFADEGVVKLDDKARQKIFDLAQMLYSVSEEYTDIYNYFICQEHKTTDRYTSSIETLSRLEKQLTLYNQRRSEFSVDTMSDAIEGLLDVLNQFARNRRKGVLLLSKILEQLNKELQQQVHSYSEMQYQEDLAKLESNETAASVIEAQLKRKMTLLSNNSEI